MPPPPSPPQTLSLSTILCATTISWSPALSVASIPLDKAPMPENSWYIEPKCFGGGGFTYPPPPSPYITPPLPTMDNIISPLNCATVASPSAGGPPCCGKPQGFDQSEWSSTTTPRQIRAPPELPPCRMSRRSWHSPLPYPRYFTSFPISTVTSSDLRRPPQKDRPMQGL